MPIVTNQIFLSLIAPVIVDWSICIIFYHFCAHYFLTKIHFWQSMSKTVKVRKALAKSYFWKNVIGNIALIQNKIDFFCESKDICYSIF